MTEPMQAKLWQVTAETAEFPVPSGQSITLQDLFWEEGEELILRVRFLAPAIARDGGTVAHDVASADMLYLCEAFVLPQIAAGPDSPTQVILSLSDIAVPFGEANPDATQFFEAYIVDGDSCISEVF